MTDRNWGGRREGAGRKVRGYKKSEHPNKPLSITVSFRLTKEDYDKLAELDPTQSANFIARQVILDYLKK